MAKPRVLVLRAPGTNCDVETAYAFELAGAEPVRLHVNQLIAQPALASTFQILCFPGGFSYGDDIAAGRILAAQLHTFLNDVLETFRQQDRLVLGICNGFQIMIEAGLLPGGLLRNATLRFLSMDCRLRVERPGTAFTAHWRQGDCFRAPMAHGDGNYFADEATLDRLEGEGLVAFRYVDEAGQVTEAANRNGSARNIAGILSPNLRVCGLMPHPEDLVDPLMGGEDGLPMFQSLTERLVAA